MSTDRRTLEMALGALNGLVGDHLHRTDNGLATPMTLALGGRPLPLDRAALSAALPGASPRVLVLVHGLMATEHFWEFPDGSTYGSRLAAELGWTPLYLRYNSGRHVAENGEDLATLLEGLLAAYPGPIEEISLLGHSMGGLVARSACHAAGEAGHAWLPRVRRAFYVGTPHLGAPLERAGNVIAWALRRIGDRIGDPYTQLVADVANLRSTGIKDLRFGSVRRADWEGADADALLSNRAHPVPLLPHIQHFLVAGTVSRSPILTALFGDALVPVPSATRPRRDDAERERAPLPPEHVRILPEVGHAALAHHEAVYQQLLAWCRPGPG